MAAAPGRRYRLSRPRLGKVANFLLFTDGGTVS
jgi:hypothetical protein